MSTHTPPPEGSGEPEYLDQGAGEPAAQSSDGGGGGRRTAVVAGAVVLALAAAGAGTWAAVNFFGSGAQPAEALPAGTLAYASVDLDPSGSQKIEALQMLRKFPAFREEVGVETDDDIRRKVFEAAGDECPDLDYDRDIEPWIGTSFAIAAVEAGEDEPSPVGVVDVTDPEAAEKGLAALAKCGGEDQGGWVIEGDWAVLAETDEIAQKVTDTAAEGTLADDSSYQEWMEKAGEPGVVSMYAAPEVGPLIGDLLASDLSMVDPGLADEPEVPEEMAKQLEEFPGAAATVRFGDGSLELEVVGGVADQPYFPEGEESAEVVTSLPSDTAVAFGVVLKDGWAQALLDQIASASGGQMSAEDLVAQAEAMTGLTLPEDVETLLGDSTAVAMSGDFSVEDAANSADGSDIPVGVKVRGDADEVQRIVGQLASAAGPQGEAVLGTDAEGDTVAIGPSPDYRSSLLGDGGLGDSETFKDVVPEAERSPVVLFVNFDAGEWLSGMTAGDAEAEANLEPLGALGYSVWQDEDTTHGLLKLTTN